MMHTLNFESWTLEATPLTPPSSPCLSVAKCGRRSLGEKDARQARESERAAGAGGVCGGSGNQGVDMELVPKKNGGDVVSSQPALVQMMERPRRSRETVVQ